MSNQFMKKIPPFIIEIDGDLSEDDVMIRFTVNDHVATLACIAGELAVVSPATGLTMGTHDRIILGGVLQMWYIENGMLSETKVVGELMDRLRNSMN